CNGFQIPTRRSPTGKIHFSSEKQGFLNPPRNLLSQARRRRQAAENLAVRHQDRHRIHRPRPLAARLKSFESSVSVSRKAFRLGKFIQDVNAALRAAVAHSHLNLLLSAVAYGGEGLYFFLEQFVWLGKSGLIDKRHLPVLQKLSAWFEFIGYFGSVSLKVIELRKIDEEERCLASTVNLTLLRGINGGDEMEKLRKLKEKKTMKRFSVVQDLANGLMAFADIRDGGGSLSSPLLLSSAGMLSAVISTHKNWISC
ncbi:hypothetical protein ACP275_03G062200, partial [Erythranthe tilingii]